VEGRQERERERERERKHLPKGWDELDTVLPIILNWLWVREKDENREREKGMGWGQAVWIDGGKLATAEG
jgi:hypothetical protein